MLSIARMIPRNATFAMLFCNLLIFKDFCLLKGPTPFPKFNGQGRGPLFSFHSFSLHSIFPSFFISSLRISHNMFYAVTPLPQLLSHPLPSLPTQICVFYFKPLSSACFARTLDMWPFTGYCQPARGYSLKES